MTCGSGDLVREGDDGATGTPYGLATGLHGKNMSSRLSSDKKYKR
jgi:hypothetical protein